ncbi:hypothetical protein NC653_012349 [Populus alba x Populus x berolinensis]|uniref:Uncharacterized protein n=1 Tax=Populus alba x Populus x berolinensis TaxID=444605 RepID=A0AAD6R4X0_9ROSI|nr:hypothetical protein NC653_012349 [Populus alba x Populus x berolinensis]
MHFQLTVPIIHARSSHHRFHSVNLVPPTHCTYHSCQKLSTFIHHEPFPTHHFKTHQNTTFRAQDLVSGFSPHGTWFIRFSPAVTKCSRARDVHLAAAEATQSSCSSSRASPVIASKILEFESIEENIEKVIYRCRFLAILGVLGSMGCTYVGSAFMQYLVNRSKVIILLVEAIDLYLLGTVMLVFGMGLYELFVSNLDLAKQVSTGKAPNRSSLFGLFALKERPKWLEVKTV